MSPRNSSKVKPFRRVWSRHAKGKVPAIQQMRRDVMTALKLCEIKQSTEATNVMIGDIYKDWTNDELIRAWSAREGTGKRNDEVLCDEIEKEIELRGDWMGDTIYERNNQETQPGSFVRTWEPQ